MYFDNLTIAGILMVAPYALLPLLFGRELVRVADDQPESPQPARVTGENLPGLPAGIDCRDPEPCR